MFDKFLKIVFPNSESSFVNYILPTIVSLASILLLWLLLISFAQFIKVKAEQWKQDKHTLSFGRRLVVSQKSFIRKSLTAFRRIISLYILILLASHILATFSKQLRTALISSTSQSVNMWATIAHYTDLSSTFFDKFADLLLNIFLTVLIAIWCMRILQKTLDIFLHTSAKYKSGLENSRSLAKKNTLNAVTSYLLKIIISVIAIFTILQNLGINIAALLATAGLASVAIGFGAQNLVKDFIAGFFILFEDQFAVGDSVELGTTSSLFSGTVEKMTLRMARIRSNEGSLVTVPNGDIRSVKNYSTDWSRIDFKFNLILSTQIEKAAAIFKQEVERLYHDFPTEIIDSPDIRPLEKIVDFENKSVATTLRAFIKTIDTKTKVKLEMELNTRLLASFKKEDVPLS